MRSHRCRRACRRRDTAEPSLNPPRSRDCNGDDGGSKHLIRMRLCAPMAVVFAKSQNFPSSAPGHADIVDPAPRPDATPGSGLKATGRWRSSALRRSKVKNANVSDAYDATCYYTNEGSGVVIVHSSDGAAADDACGGSGARQQRHHAQPTKLAIFC